jgi:cell division protein FtsN
VKSGGLGSTFLGILIGLVLGLMIALGVAWYINKLPNPFREKPQAPAVPAPPAAKAGATATTPTAAKDAASTAKATEPPADKDKDKDKAKAPDAAKSDATAEKTADKSTPAPKETFFLQAGSFQSAPDADNLKARLALMGIEAAIQTRTLPEKGVFHRVRIGPYADVEELNRVRAVLTQNGIEAALVKVREADK